MVESLMLIALGFMIATFIGILLSQFIWRRAVTVTTRRLQDGPTLPLEDTPSQADSAAARENEAALHAVRQELTQAKEELSTSKATIESLQSAAQGDTADKGSLAQEIEQKNQEIERVTAELAKSDAKVEAAKGALTEAETKILTLSSDAATKAKEVTELNQALSQSKQEAETAQSGRLKAEGILANVSAAATALMASLPTEAEPAQNEEADEPHKAVEAEDDTATEESAESVESVEASAEEASSDTLIMAASEEKTAPQEDISSETSPLAALQEETAPDASSPPSSTAPTPATDPSSEQDRSALVAAVPTLDEFSAEDTQAENPEDTRLADAPAVDSKADDETSLASVTTLDARIEALKEGVASPA